MVFDVFSQRTVHSARPRAAGPRAQRRSCTAFSCCSPRPASSPSSTISRSPSSASPSGTATFYLRLQPDCRSRGPRAQSSAASYMMWRRWKIPPRQAGLQSGSIAARPRSGRSPAPGCATTRCSFWALLLIGVTGFLQEGVRAARHGSAGLGGVGRRSAGCSPRFFLGWAWTKRGPRPCVGPTGGFHGIAALAFIAANSLDQGETHYRRARLAFHSATPLALRRLPQAGHLAGGAEEAEPDVGISSIGAVLVEGPAQPRRLHQVRPLPRGLPGDRERRAAQPRAT